MPNLSLLFQLTAHAAKKWPGNKALIEAENGRSVSYKEFDNKINAFCACLAGQGLKKEERVGILCRNSIEGIAVFFSIIKAGGIAVPLNHELGPSDIIEQAGMSGLSGLYAGDELKDKAKKIRAKVRSIRFNVDVVQRRSYSRDNKRLFIREGDPALIIFTSGSTGAPLGVTLSHRNLISNSAAIVKYAGISKNDRSCCVLPLYYIYGLSLVLSHFMTGGTVIIDNRFMYPSLVLDAIDRYGATCFAGVSSHFAILLYKSDFKCRPLHTVRYCMQAGDAMPPHFIREIARYFPDKKLYIMYGLTEASPRLTYLDPKLVLKKPSSVGRAISGVKIKIIGQSGKECKPGKTGEIIARGNNIMIGYWNNSAETAKRIKRGWLYTGDLGLKDKDGDLFIVGRKNKIIKVGGKRVGLFEIEHLATEDKSVMEAAAISFRDDILGEKIKLFVTPIPGRKINAVGLMNLYQSRLPSYKVPSEIVVLNSIPKNNYGKVNKEKLRGI